MAPESGITAAAIRDHIASLLPLDNSDSSSPDGTCAVARPGDLTTTLQSPVPADVNSPGAADLTDGRDGRVHDCDVVRRQVHDHEMPTIAHAPMLTGRFRARPELAERGGTRTISKLGIRAETLCTSHTRAP